jgi:hypothetical protein
MPPIASLERLLRKGDKGIGWQHRLSPLSSRPRAKATSPSIAPKRMTMPASTASSCCAPTPISLRWAAMLRCKQLWSVEQTLRTTKHLLATRPIFHRLDETIRGHVFCSFLALVLKAELEARIADLGYTASWPALIADLDALTETEVEQGSRRRAAANRAGCRRNLITVAQHVVPSRRNGENCRAYSITCQKMLLRRARIARRRDHRRAAREPGSGRLTSHRIAATAALLCGGRQPKPCSTACSDASSKRTEAVGSDLPLRKSG